MKNILVLSFISVFFLGCVATAADPSTPATSSPASVSTGGSRWVVSAGTTLKAEAAAASADTAALQVGALVTVLESSGRWLKVQSSTRQIGWVFSGRLSSTPPVAEVAASDDIFAASAQQSQIDVAQADSARSIRGLSPEAENYAQERGTPQEYRKALDQILARQVNQGEVSAFIKAGKLGEFAP